MGEQTYGFPTERKHIKRSMKYIESHITTEEMEVLQKKGEGASKNDKTTSLKNTCNAIYIKAKDAILESLGETESDKAKRMVWSKLKKGKKLYQIEQKMKAAKVDADIEKSKKGGGLFGKKGEIVAEVVAEDNDDDSDDDSDDGE